ncbi:hypothetical protein [Planococcus sp. 4-30]|uniref:hypothetical protein n=1 Tax=Planococcus sp. 4-30 TaxID=2874583 RepID=UPI001CBCA33C|nr:hypothetical protein [Planococcus sp. 4-30]
MKKIFLFVLVCLFLLCLGAAASYLHENYHKTPESALEELRQQTDGHVLSLPMNDLVLLIDGNGDVAIAFMAVERLFNIYKDFEVIPTPLNIYRSDLDNEIPYAIGPWYLEVTFGLIKNKKVAYTAQGSTVRKDNVSPVYGVEDVLSDADLSGVKVWFITSRSTSQVDVENNVLFLNEKREPIKMENKEFSAEND